MICLRKERLDGLLNKAYCCLCRDVKLLHWVKGSGGQATGTTLELHRSPAVAGLLEGPFVLGFRARQGVAMRLTDNRCCCALSPHSAGSSRSAL